MKFNKIIKEIQDNNEFFGIDYNDILENFDEEIDERRVKVGLNLSIINVAFVDAVRGDISRPKFIDRLITIFRQDFIEDIKNRDEKIEFKGNDIE